MATDPNIILAASAQPVQVAGPLDDYQKLLALKNAQQSNALNAQQLQASQLENQQRQLQMQQTQALNDAYKSAITPAADGSTTIDSDKLTNALAQSGHGSAIPTVMKGVTDYQKSLADLKNGMADLQKKQVDFAGGVGATLQQSNYDPRLFLTLGSHAVADKAVNGAAINPLLQQVQSALQQDPSGASARQIVRKIADQWVAQSPEQQKIIAANTTAGARKLTADTQAGKQAIEAPGQAADALTKQVASASQQLAGAKSQQEYAALLGELPQKIAKLMPAPETWNAQTTPKAVLQAGLTPEQKVTSAQGAQRVAIAQQDANANTTRAGVEAASAAAAPNLTPEALDNAARLYGKTGELPAMGMGKGGAAVRQAVMNRSAVMNGGGNDIASNRAIYKSNVQALGKLQVQSDLVDAFESGASKNIDYFLKVGKQITDSGVPLANTPLRAIDGKLLGTAQYGAFNVAWQTATSEAAKVLNSANASGVALSDSARKDAQTLLDKNATYGQWVSAAQGLKQDFANRKQANKETIGDIQDRMLRSGSGSKGQSGSAPADYVFHPGTGLQKAQ